MIEKPTPRFEVVRGDKDLVMELSMAAQTVLRNLPDAIDMLIDHDEVREKRKEIILWTNQQLIEYLKSDILFSDLKTASTTWAVLDVAKGKTVPPVA